MKYYVTYKVEARYIAEVEADSIEEAMKKAESEYLDADFGAIDEVVDGEAIIIEDADGNYVWEK